ncbi:MAG: hypothetical protein N3B12_04555 [Armatimonadetes bacterium]|nr:hypothetical protein [Armatimonadota bacterium]
MRSSRAKFLMLILTVMTAGTCAALIAGCGKNEIVEVPIPPASSTSPTPKVPATGPAISSPVSFGQLALETPVKKVKRKNGLVFLRFAYADNDGKIYQCELPEPMSKGEYPPQEWLRLFNVYRLPKVIGQKKLVQKKGPRVIGDFPFISPRPQPEKTPTEQQRPTPTPQPIQLPAPPPTQTPAQPTNPGNAPSMPPISPRPPSNQ